MVHRGQIAEKRVRNSGIPITEVAKRIRKSQRTMYNYFAEPNLSVEIMSEIGKAINHDFSNDLKGTDYSLTQIKELMIAEESSEQYSENWKIKYFDILEKYTKLLEQSENNRESLSKILSKGLNKISESIQMTKNTTSQT